MHESLAWGSECEEIEDYLQICGGESYQSDLRKTLNLHGAKEAILTATVQLENRIVQYGAGEVLVCIEEGRLFTKSLLNGYVVWSEKAASIGTQAESWRIEYEQMAKKYLAASNDSAAVTARLQTLRTKLLAAPDFLGNFEAHITRRGYERGGTGESLDSREIAVNFDSKHFLLKDGAAAILMRTDRRWWNAFRQAIKSKVNQLRKGAIRIMLRDVMLYRFVEDSKFTRSVAWIDLLNEPSSFPTNLRWVPYKGRGSRINEDDIRFWRLKLRKEDQDARKWLSRHGGVCHPCNWLLPANDSLMQVRNEYPPERAKNEMYWCLCDGSEETFAPLSSRTYPLEKWRAWVDGITDGTLPKYWERISSARV